MLLKVATVPLIAALLAIAPVATGQVVGPIQFTEPEFPLYTVVNGLSVSTLNGVPIVPISFGFQSGGVPSTDCTVSGGPGTTTYVSDPSIEGAPGELTITFGSDLSDFQFGFAVLPGGGGGRRGSGPVTSWSTGSAPHPLAVTGAVQLTGYTAVGAAVGSVTVDAIDLPGDTFPGNLAVLSSATPFRRVVISWNSQALSAFALDNLQVRQAGEAIVPSLSGLGLAALAAAIVLAGIAALRLRT